MFLIEWVDGTRLGKAVSCNGGYCIIWCAMNEFCSWQIGVDYIDVKGGGEVARERDRER